LVQGIFTSPMRSNMLLAFNCIMKSKSESRIHVAKDWSYAFFLS
jgi:hypothetical protein